MAWLLALFVSFAAAQEEGTITSGTSEPPPRAGLLTAGDVDDNLNFEFYKSFQNRTGSSLAAQSEYSKLSNTIFEPTLEDRLLIQVNDNAGTPFSCAVVEACCTANGGRVELPTGSNGKLSLFPTLDGLVGDVRVRARASDATCPTGCSDEVANYSNGNLSLTVPGTSSLPTQLDVTFTVDTTGSMGDELRYLQTEIQSILDGLPSVDVRAGIVLYKDEGDSYVVQSTALGPVTSAVKALSAATADGGGDYPEAMAEAMQAAVALDWRAGNVARVMFLVADAPPHTARFQQTLSAAQVARSKGIKVYGLAASGVGDSAEYLMRLMSMLTGSRYLWLTDDSGIGNSHAEPKVQCYQVTRLDLLIQRVLLSELQGQRVEPEPGDIIREVGRQDAGVCLVELSTTTTATTTLTTTVATTSLGQDEEPATTTGLKCIGCEVGDPGDVARVAGDMGDLSASEAMSSGSCSSALKLLSLLAAAISWMA